jgi:hypothetical protein
MVAGRVRFRGPCHQNFSRPLPLGDYTPAQCLSSSGVLRPRCMTVSQGNGARLCRKRASTPSTQKPQRSPSTAKASYSANLTSRSRASRSRQRHEKVSCARWWTRRGRRRAIQRLPTGCMAGQRTFYKSNAARNDGNRSGHQRRYSRRHHPWRAGLSRAADPKRGITSIDPIENLIYILINMILFLLARAYPCH